MTEFLMADFMNDMWSRFINGTITDPLEWAIVIVAGIIVVVALISTVISIWLSVRYIRFNRKQNSAGITGVDAARRILDQNGLQDIRVKTTGSLLFGNSYSHYFRKVRLRRLTRNKTSISSLAMGAQKSCLAILDKEGDKDMKARIIFTPIQLFGPYAFFPLLIIGVLLDVIISNTIGIFTVIFAVLGLLFFFSSFILSVLTLKTEKKAQVKAYEIMRENGMVTQDELDDIKSLFKLYNIEYINNIILSTLELIYRILVIIGYAKNSNSRSSNN